MEDNVWPLAIVISGVLVLSLIGGLAIAMDARTFSTITKECKEKGRIQNDTTRIFCQVEEVKSNTN